VFTYVNPAVALTAGVLVLNEPLTPWNVGTLVLILIGCVLATRRHEVASSGDTMEPTQIGPR
jgi:drug/metabolite transporter (DMT)-like permease